MSWCLCALIELREHAIDRRCYFQIVLLEEHEVRIAFDANVAKLDPLVIGHAHLLEVLDEAVVVCDVRAGLAGDHDVRHFVELGELVDRACLQHAGAFGGSVWSNLDGGDGGAVCN